MAVLQRRDVRWDDNDDYYWGYYSPAALIIKWTIIGVVLLLIAIWLIGGYFHAQRRMKKGLPPLLYHRFLVSRRQRARFEPQPAFSFYNQQGQAYPMNTYAPPPPPYNPQFAQPPTYQPPEGGTKVNPEQAYTPAQPGPAVPGPSHGPGGYNAPTNFPQAQAAPLPAEADNHPGQLPPRSPTKPGLVARFNPFKR